jgi:HPt (histidine-containing phosphotransfer) domain-containing protein
MNTLVQGRAPTEAPAFGSFDWAGLLRLVEGDRELARELVSIFLEDEPVMRAEMAGAIRSESAESLAHAAHAYKGSAAAVGAASAAEAASVLEMAGRAGRLRVASEWRRFEELANSLREELAVLCKT